MSTFLFDLAGAQCPCRCCGDQGVGAAGPAALASLVLRRRASAATRHWVWTFAVAGLLCCPCSRSPLPAGTSPCRLAVSPTRRLRRSVVASRLQPSVWRRGFSAALTLESSTTADVTLDEHPGLVDRRDNHLDDSLLGLYAAGALLLSPA